MITKVSNRGIELIKKFEAFRSSPYLDSGGIATIGYGATYYPNGQRVTLNDPAISEEWADTMLHRMLHTYEVAVNSFTRDDINQNQFDALTSFAYNIGTEALRRSTLIKLVNINPNDPNIAYQFSRWNKDNGKVINGLTKRRRIESDLYFS